MLNSLTRVDSEAACAIAAALNAVAVMVAELGAVGNVEIVVVIAGIYSSSFIASINKLSKKLLL